MSIRMVSRKTAVRALLSHQYLWPPRMLTGAAGVMEYINRVGSIQFDPVDVIGISPEIVLNARVRGFSKRTLDSLLYREKLLCDVWDKNACIAPSREFGALLENRRRSYGWRPYVHGEIDELAWERLETLLSENEYISAEMFGRDAHMREAMLRLLTAGELGIHHREGRVRFFSKVGGLLSPDDIDEVRRSPEENADYYVLRRIGGVGLLWNRRSDAFLGVHGLNARERMEAFERLEANGAIARINVDGIREPLFYRVGDDGMFSERECPQRAVLISPLDNLMWDRSLIEALFGFKYRWEIYTPEEKRIYGPYTLPVLYSDGFVARVQLARRDGELIIKDWWWEEGTCTTKKMEAAIHTAITAHAKMLGINVGV